jgi:D-3-phosphoglycerate dehydrogenase / 2-oxoglutarate reductase
MRKGIMKVAITTSSFGVYDNTPLTLLQKEQIEYSINPYCRKLTGEEIIDIAAGADGIIAGTELYSRDILKMLHNLKVISRCGVGMDNVDTISAQQLGIKVLNTPEGPTLAVAELTVGLILNLLRKLGVMDRQLRNGVWKKQMGNLLKGKKVAIIGFGRIGQKVAELLRPFGVEIAYNDTCQINTPFPSNEKENLLAWADIITLHCSVDSECKSIIGAEEFKKMKKGAWLINASRGGLVDENALYESLVNGQLSGAALDVFEKEPYKGTLCELDNVILTPHIGSYAKEGRIKMETTAVENLIQAFNQ